MLQNNYTHNCNLQNKNILIKWPGTHIINTFSLHWINHNKSHTSAPLHYMHHCHIFSETSRCSIVIVQGSGMWAGFHYIECYSAKILMAFCETWIRDYEEDCSPSVLHRLPCLHIVHHRDISSSQYSSLINVLFIKPHFLKLHSTVTIHNTQIDNN